MYKKEIHNIPADLYGPFVRLNKSDKWHSSKICSKYPSAKEIELKFFSSYPLVNELCPECIEIEKRNININF